jgi:hypothetical protein
MADSTLYPGLEVSLNKYMDKQKAEHGYPSANQVSSFVLGYKAALDYLAEQNELKFQEALAEGGEFTKTMDGDDIDLQF